MIYWKRDYQLRVGVGSQAVTIAPPFRVSFTVDKSIDVGLNKAKIRIWGLKQSTRLKLIKDEWSQDYFPIELMIGYGGKLEVLFRGSVRQGDFNREGADFISTLDCFDGGVDTVNGFTNTVATTRKGVVEAALADMPNTKEGAITKEGDLIRPVVLIGNSANLIQQQLDDDEHFFIDNEQLFVINKNEVRSNYAPLVSAKTGLMNTPVVSKGKINFDTMINPTLKLAGLCKVESKYNPEINGVYRIEQMSYTGDYKGNDWVQTVSGRLASNVRAI